MGRGLCGLFSSHGVKELAGDSWIPMDASFKQYDFTTGMSLKDQFPFDAEALADSIQSKAIVNEEEGWVQNVPQEDIEAQLESFQAQLKKLHRKPQIGRKADLHSEAARSARHIDVPSEKIWKIDKSNLELALSKINLGADAERIFAMAPTPAK